MNRTEEKIHKEKNPIIKANICSKFFFWWLKDIFKIGVKRPLGENEIYECRNHVSSNTLTDKFSAVWNEELKKKNPSVLRMLFKLYGAPLLTIGLAFSFLESVMRVIQPLCLGGLVSYFAPNQTTISKDEAYFYAGGIIFSSTVSVLTFHPFILYILTMGGKMRLGCSGLVYKKVLRLSKAAVYEGLNGKVINIMSNDLARFELALAFMHDVWKGPLEAILFSYFIYEQIGISAVIGMAFLLSFIPLQAWIGKKAAQLRLRTTKRTDYRVKIMNEIILGIQVIKMYTWEKSFATMVDKIRKKEMNAIRGTAYIRATLFSFGMVSRLSIFLSLVSYVYFDNVITAKKVYIVTSFFNILNLSMVYFWPVALTCVAEGYISAKRLQEFLLASEDKRSTASDNSTKKEKKMALSTIRLAAENSKRIENIDAKNVGIQFENGIGRWERSDSFSPGLSEINLKINDKELCAIVGQVGAGKSTLLHLITGELELDAGRLIVNGRISYAAQEAWLFEGSIRSNIVFTDEYDEKRYKKVVRVCALEKDFKLLPYGDSTIVGERGISLSGGQKARVNLARAIYKQADIYILDDPLSAVDTHVGKHIFEECVEKFLKDKICILVTHQLQYLKDVKNLVFISDGRIEAQGSYEDMQKLTNDPFFAEQMATEVEEKTTETKTKTERQRSVSLSTTSGIDEEDTMDRHETQAVGQVKFDIYKSFFKSIDSTFYLVFLLAFFFFAQAAVSGVDYFVAQWVNWEERTSASKFDDFNQSTTTMFDVDGAIAEFATGFTAAATAAATMALYSNNDDTVRNINSTLYDDVQIENITALNNEENSDEIGQREWFIIYYAILMAIATYVYVHRTFAFFSMCLKASIKLHDKLFRGITRAAMFFYNNNPSGRILNRFSKDINSMDSLLPPALMDCLSFFFEITATMVIVAIVNYWLLIPTFFISILFYCIRYVYINTARSVKRLESLTRSPVYSHTNATLQGLSTVRVYRAEKVLQQEFFGYQDHNTCAWYLSLTTSRAFALWLDMVCLIYIAVVTLSFLVLEQDKSSGNVGLAILQCINMIGMCQWGMRQTAEVENQMTSVERVLEYADLPSEPPLESQPKHRPPTNWPNTGKIIFSDLSFKYSENSNFVLRNLNFQINPMEKIGIVGRTGAGKSSLIQALFRLAELDGSILIDEIEINTLGLHDLRSKISIIPQDPVLFSGTLRFNLDPFDENKDEDMWNALAQVELKPFISSMVGGLDCKMSDGGSNFSMGQRQLVCLARAILRNNKILILDEATANVDPETDKLIQTTIRTKFANCTVLTIAHRLHTVMDSDRVLVIDAGHVVEFGHAHDLLQISDGYLRQLVDQTGSATAALLAQTALQSYSTRTGEGKQH